ncbi:MAG: hypothetical protein ACP5MC_02830 [Candidatus Micrarchaeia archaeon]
MLYQIDQQQVMQVQPTPQPAGSPQPASSGSSTMPAPKQRPGKTKAAIAGLVVLIVALAIAYLLLSQKPAGKSAIYSLLSPGKTLPLNRFVQLVNTSFSYVNKTNVSYSGSLNFSESSGNFSTSSAMPMRLDFLKNGTSERAYLLMSAPIIGNLSLIEVLSGGKYYACINSTALAAGSASPSNSSFVCMYQASATNLAGLSNNISGTVHVSSFAKSSYKGIPCMLLKGYLSMNTSSTSSIYSALSALPPSKIGSINANFSMCFDENSNIPLSIFVESRSNVTNPNTGTAVTISEFLNLNETSISSSVPSGISTLPGPVLNSTELANLGIA